MRHRLAVTTNVAALLATLVFWWLLTSPLPPTWIDSLRFFAL